MITLENFCKNHISSKYATSRMILEAFSHFTYNFTKRKMLVTDLRTLAINQNEIMLLEPIIYSVDSSRFSSTNLNERGFKLFNDEHMCNIICEKRNYKMFE